MASADAAGVVTRFGLVPVKGLRVNEPDEILLEGYGAVGDRDFVLIDPDDRYVSVASLELLLRLVARWEPERQWLSITDDDGAGFEETIRLGRAVIANYYDIVRVPSREVDGPWNALLSEVAGTPLRLVKTEQPGTGKDLGPVSLLGEASLEELTRHLGTGPLDVRRFRMLIHFRSDEPHLEDTWVGREVSVGEARIRIDSRVGRCAVTTRDPERGERNAPVVRAIRGYRGIQDTAQGPGVVGPGVAFGVFAYVLRGGTVRVGDPLHVLDA